MAQRTSAERLLARLARATNARVFLALVVAALALAGCGGGSSSSSSSASTAASGSSASAGGSANGSVGGAGGGAASGKQASGEGGSPGEGGEGGEEGTSSGGKHGPRVPQPKGKQEPGITPQQRKEATVADMKLESPSVGPASGGVQTLPAKYTCNGANIFPSLRWQGVPDGTAELALFVMNIQPVEEKLFFDWAVAGLSPDLEELQAGKLPKGAVVGRNSFGDTNYALCPNSTETFMFALFAVPKKLSPSKGFEPLALRKEVLDSSGDVGLLALSYTPG